MLHALELGPDEPGQQAVRRDWQALREAGLPSQLDHAGATNAPHVTVVAAPELPAAAERLAVSALGTMLPLRVRASGLLILGGERVTLARTVDVDDDATRAVLDVRAATPGRQHVGWLPHVTLARRVLRTDVQRAVEVLGHADVELELTGLRRWNPTAGTARLLTSVMPGR